MMTKLTDTQNILLATAAARDSASLYPLPTTLRPGGGLAKALAALAARGLTEQRETAANDEIAHEDGDLRIGVYATPAGLAAIGIVAENGGAGEGNTAPAPVGPVAGAAESSAAPAPTAAKPLSKMAQVAALLVRDEGATLDQLIAVTGWLPHTTRAALTGLKKKGYAISSDKAGGVRTYRAVAPEAK